MGVPGWPLLAFCTASMARQRTVSMQSLSMFVAEKVKALPRRCVSLSHSPKPPLTTMLRTGPYERGEQGVGLQRLGLELGVELAAQEVGMVGDLHDLHEGAVRAHAGEGQPLGLHGLAVFGLVELVAVPVAFADLLAVVGLGSLAVG